jgi:hypothetical protein
MTTPAVYLCNNMKRDRDELGRPASAFVRIRASWQDPALSCWRPVAPSSGRPGRRDRDLLQITGVWRPDIVIRESQEFAALLAAEHHGIPHARVGLGLARTEAQTIAFAAPAVDQLGMELKLPAASLGFYPDLYRHAIDALAELPIRLLVTVGPQSDPAALAPLPAHVRVERWLPQATVLPHVAAVVCHGGYGTSLGALAAGVPLVLMPLFAGDQWQLASRIGEIGAGILLEEEPRTPRTTFAPPSSDTIAGLPGAVSDVLNDPGYRGAAATIADAIGRLPPIEAAADFLRAHAEQASAVNRTATHRRSQ